MKKNLFFLASLATVLMFPSCKNVPSTNYAWIKKSLDVASYQLKMTADEIADSTKVPRSIWKDANVDFLAQQLGRGKETFQDSLRVIAPSKLGHRRLTSVYDWTSGFFPGSLWYTYEMTGNESLKNNASKFTNLLNPVKEFTGTHDLGFMMYCSYGNAERITHNDTIPRILVQTADNLASRFDNKIGCIRSWDFGPWNFPVIIDNMMNLDLLFYASKYTGDNKYMDVAIKHANTTMKHHFRPDYTSYHVVSYNADGTVECKQTHQGLADSTAWARGQAWGVYGYTACYRETKNIAYLDFAQKLADMIMKRVKTDDLIPLWDYDAPASKVTPRDASAAAVTASALIELSTMVRDGSKYLDYAEKLLKALSSDKYLAKKGTNQGFVLLHSTGSLPHGSEVDVPLNYADYYYLEAIKRYMDLKKIKYNDL